MEKGSAGVHPEAWAYLVLLDVKLEKKQNLDKSPGQQFKLRCWWCLKKTKQNKTKNTKISRFVSTAAKLAVSAGSIGDRLKGERNIRQDKVCHQSAAVLWFRFAGHGAAETAVTDKGLQFCVTSHRPRGPFSLSGLSTQSSCGLLGHSFVTQTFPCRAVDGRRFQNMAVSQDGLTSRTSQERIRTGKTRP